MKRRARSLEKALARSGRFGDTELAHVNPREKALLMALGGAGTRNPRTGLQEFFDIGSDGGGYGAEGSEFGGGTFGGQDFDPTGTVDGSVYDSGSQGPGQAPGPGERDAALGDLGLGGTGGGTGVYDSGMQGPGQAPAPGQRDVALGDLDRGTGERSLVERALAQIDPRTQTGLFNIATALAPTQFSLGSRAMYEGMRALGDYVGQPLNDMFGGNAKAVDFDYGNGGRFSGDQFAGMDMGAEGINSSRLGDVMAKILDAQPIAAPLSRLDSGEAPDEISSFMGPGMTDLQRRALISTYGTQGVNSAFKSDPVKRYYARLLRNGLIDEQGGLYKEPYTLPIEHLYWQGVLGNPVANTGDPNQIMAVANRFL